MHRQAFEQHAIWAQIEDALNRVKEVQETQPPADEVPMLLRIEFVLKYVDSYRSLAATSSALFNEQLLGPVQSIAAQIVSYLQQRQANYNYRPYTENALGSAESLLVQIGNWPRPYAKGAQIQQINTLYEGLLEMQEQQIAEFEARYDATRDRLSQLVSDLDAKKAQVEGEFELYRTEALAVSSAVDHEKSRIDDVVQKGLEKVADLQARNTDAFDEWKQQAHGELEDYTDAQKDAIDKTLNSATGALKTLKENEKEYANISAAAGGAKLAGEFNTEASSAQKLGLRLYMIGFGVLVLAALPLVLWLFFPPVSQQGDGIWQHFLIRISLGVLGASAATVLIRLGSRFVTGATASKRMALELQTFGPFLANVKDKETVDSARLELVDRAFGKSYAPGESDSKDEAVPVTAFAHILDLVKAIK
ncbi:hypothetical protein [Arthrobacter sp. 8AJ]|uniref:hypothetical protein n=1 Tax=Arthrobacter sp. 8AJ TaxID=2653130 RepID=UPI00135C3260|nr:hypothetical protein [Arthrobacter sp. 8AJ]